MSTYACTKPGCIGKVTFPDGKGQPKTDDKPKKWDLTLSVITGKPAQCSVCGTSYYEGELGGSS